MALSDSVLALAETPNTYYPLGEGQELVVTDRYVLWIGEVDHPMFTVAQRFRLADDVEDAVGEIRAAFRARGRLTSSFEIGPTSRPHDLHDRLVQLGMRPWADEPITISMVLTTPPAGEPGEATARRVETVDELIVADDIAAAVFGLDEEQRAANRAGAAERFAAGQAGGPSATFLAFVDGEPVASARAVFADAGVLLSAGGTLEHARGRGAYRALVAARWEEAQRRGVPLVTQAGHLSRPILKRLGFREVCEVRVLVDEFG